MAGLFGNLGGLFNPPKSNKSGFKNFGSNPRPVEGGGALPKAGIGGQGTQLNAGIPVGFNPLFGGGGLSGMLQQAFNDTTSEFNSAINQPIGPQDPRFGAFGGFLQNLAMNPQGFGGETMKRLMTRLAERNAGVTESQKRTLRDTGGQNFSSFGDVMANIEGQGAQRLNEAELQAFLQDAALRSQARGQGIQGSLGLSNISAALAQMAAQFAANRQRPLTEGGSGGTGAGNKYDLLNENGEIVPFRADGTPLSAFEQERARQQRKAWMAEQGG